jgi:two-component system response regulator AlgR
VKILIVDDEPLARARLTRLVRELGSPFEVVGEAANGSEALRRCADQAPELVLLDIRMPGLGGLEVARLLAELPERPAVIFVTAYEEYALAAFAAHADDYLLKPVRREHLVEALQRAQRLTRAQRVTLPQGPTDVQPQGHLTASYRGGLRTLALEDILYLRAEDKYVTAVTREERLLLQDSLKQLEERFPGKFLRIHRNALVASHWIRGIERGAGGVSCAVVAGLTERLPISRRHLAAVRAWLRGDKSA